MLRREQVVVCQTGDKRSPWYGLRWYVRLKGRS